MSGIFNAGIFNNAIFNTGDAVAQDVIPEILLGGKGDNEGRRRRKKTLHLPFKPTGIVDHPRKDIERRVAESREIAAEVAVTISKELSQDNEERSEASEQGSLSAIDVEIGDLLHKEIQEQDMDVILILLTACVEARLI